MRFLSKLLKRWYIYIVPLIIIPAVVTVFARNALSIYESTALLYVNATVGGSAYATPAQNGADEMSQALQSESFCVKVAQGTDLATSYNLATQTGQDAATARIQADVSVRPTSIGQNLVTVVVDDKSAHVAQQIATSFIIQFGSYFTDYQVQFDQQQIAIDQPQLDTAKAQLAQDQQRLAQYYQRNPQCVGNPTCATTDPLLNSYQEAVTQDTQAVADITNRIRTLTLQVDGLSSGNSNPYIESDPPRLPTTTTLHLKKLAVFPAIGFAATLALILLIVGIQTVADHRVYSTGDLKTLTEDMDLDIPTIESVPILRGIGRASGQSEDADGSVSGILVPILTVLPQLGTGQMTQELRRAIGVTVEDEE